ncbi:hypothetical protein [Oceanospirillum linum]|uniref:Uncharacterized protein n=1 Tax=Oceanospirillum linum TaxID=966 RepID=A0A1T1HFC6_OCELI|nr:hypothetical protein [Oceanospirillum linum]OOV88505.1 hypothetical protein BTA35_0203085 [Oceanospirillum linum]SEF58554.1 hypothetical protein SAMN04489856_101628 [Oleiphilus messinensis]SMP06447.1 hypothetical protein SAMN06264348_101629 [Oceanospirillum linum]
MFLKVRKNCGIYMQNNESGKKVIAPVSSHFYINLNLVTEISSYSLKDPKEKQLLDGNTLPIPPGSRVLHFTMSSNFSSSKEKIKGEDGKRALFEKMFYTLFFLPDNYVEFERLKNAIDQSTLNRD